MSLQMAIAEQILIWTLTTLSILLTAKGIKTAIIDGGYLLISVISTIRSKADEVTGEKESGFWAKTRSTLLPMIDRDYFKRQRRKKLIALGYLVVFGFGIFLILTVFWALLTADITTVLERAPYLAPPVRQFLQKYQVISRVGSAVFIFGFIIEVINSFRSLF